MPDRIPVLVLVGLLASSAPAAAQRQAVEADVLFYGDNAELTNPFRDGRTIFGAAGRVWLDMALSDAASLKVGIFGLGRFGAHEFLEHAEPALALVLSRGASKLVFGSLETAQTRHGIAGPDEDTLHGLLPPLQEETLTFTRGQEMGLQWIVASRRLDHDTWINWQRLNTREARERFDAGYRGRIALMPALRLHAQWHVVHEGGEQFGVGPVRDSQGAAIGVQWTRPSGRTRPSLESHLVVTDDVPDRERQEMHEVGVGLFTRGALTRGAWRAHVIVWRGRDTRKEEGDPHYLLQHDDGTRMRGVRDYAEAGLTRHFHPAPGIHVLAAARFHRVEASYDYSFRIAARVHVRLGL
jgi:hypothetical protein